MDTQDPLADGLFESEPDSSTLEGVLQQLTSQTALLVAVATGGPRIEQVNDKYQARRRTLTAALRARGIPQPFPYADLWEWYGEWRAHYPTYADRRQRIIALERPARDALENAVHGDQLTDPGSSNHPTWTSLDARLDGVAPELRAATTLDDLQDVGRRCREILIDTAKLLADPSLVPAGQAAPKAADAKAWLDLFLAQRAAGRSHQELRALIPPAWDLAQKVTHGSIERVDAYAAAQATVLIVRTLQQLTQVGPQTSP